MFNAHSEVVSFLRSGRDGDANVSTNVYIYFKRVSIPRQGNILLKKKDMSYAPTNSKNFFTVEIREVNTSISIRKTNSQCR